MNNQYPSTDLFNYATGLMSSIGSDDSVMVTRWNNIMSILNIELV